MAGSGTTSRVTAFLHKYAEISFVVLILVFISVVFHFMPFKIAFLNFFYLPVLAAGYLMGARRAVFASVLCSVLVFAYYFIQWSADAWTGNALSMTVSDIFHQKQIVLAQLAMWSGFLMLVGGAFGKVNEHVMSSYTYVQELNQELQGQASELRELNSALQNSSRDLHRKAEELQRVSSTMDAAVAQMIIQGKLREEKRNLTALFCDLKGFTAYSHDRTPEVILDDLNKFYGTMEDIVETYHGHVDKYMGDGMMCEFGAPNDNPQHALQGALAAIRMQEKFGGWEFPWKLRVGISTGDAVVGLLGSRRRTYSAIGEVVNLASRLEELCEPGAIFTNEANNEAIKGTIKCEQIRNLGGRREGDQRLRDNVAALEKKLRQEGDNPQLLFELGKVHFSVREATKALGYFRQALKLDPENNEFKLAFAEAAVKKDDLEKISIRGLGEKQAVFAILGVRDPLLNRRRFPDTFYQRFQNVPAMLEITDEHAHPVESIDGTIGHSLCVAVLAYGIAEELGLPEDQKQDILFAGRLQDFGKGVIQQHLLNRRGGLSDQERRELEGHVTEGVVRARDKGYDKPEILDIIANHHELMNGQGYPSHSRGNEIPMGARITCVADVYSALTAGRPYRDAWTSSVSLAELRKGANSGKYDPKVVKAAVRLLS